VGRDHDRGRVDHLVDDLQVAPVQHQATGSGCAVRTADRAGRRGSGRAWPAAGLEGVGSNGLGDPDSEGRWIDGEADG
jgi:hypothetical protein